MLQPITRVYESISRNPDAVAIAGDANGDVTYAELGTMMAALATALQDLDSQPGSRVGICAWNTVEHLVALLATYAAGKVWVPLNPRNGRLELDAMVAMTRPSIIVADADCVDRFSPTSAPTVIAHGGLASDPHPTVRDLLTECAGRVPKPVERGDDDEQIIKFSGGSTGRPKAVVQSLRCLNAQATGIRDFFEFRGDDVNLIAAPLTHGASCFVLPILEAGGRHVLIDRARPAGLLDAIAAHGVTTLYAPPTLLYSLLDASESRPRSTRALRHVIYSAAPMSPGRIRDCQRVFGPVIETAYGQVEAPQIVTAMRANELLMDENMTSVGRPSPVATVRIMGASGALLPTGEVGEIVIGGPLMMTGYLDQPELTAQTIVDGWLHSGDSGWIDARGYLFIAGRLREIINTGGFKVAPSEVEVAIELHPEVVECAVFGVEDAKWGEAVNAAVVVSPGSDVTEANLIQFAREALGSVKAPKRIFLVERLERNAAGKVSRAAVRDAVISNRS